MHRSKVLLLLLQSQDSLLTLSLTCPLASQVGLAGGVETMSSNPMAWEGGVNPRIPEFPKAQVSRSVPLACLACIQDQPDC
jgi:hypothetical protein